MSALTEAKVVVGNVITMDPACPRAEAIAIDDGTVVAVGTVEEASAALPGAPVHRPDAAAGRVLRTAAGLRAGAA